MNRITFLKNEQPYSSLSEAKQALRRYAQANSLIDGEPIIGRYYDGSKISVILGVCTVTGKGESGCITDESITFFVGEETFDNIKLESLLDVEILDKIEGDVLYYNGESWVNKSNSVFDPEYEHIDNNFTDELKEKLDKIEEGAQVNVQSDWNETDTEKPTYIKNKPVIPDNVWEKGTGEHSIQSKDTGCEAKCDYSVAEGHNSKVVKDGIDPLSGQASHAEGSGSIAKGYATHVEGGMTMALNSYSHAEGYYTTAGGDCSHVEGNHTITNNFGEHAEGRYNVSHKNSDDTGDPLNTQHSIGIGFYSPSFEFENSKNAVEVMQNGDTYIIGVGDYNGKNIESAQSIQELFKHRPLPYPSIKKINEFAYRIYCDYLDYDFAIDYYNSENETEPVSGCSSMHHGKLYGRNFDWIYNNDVEFVVETPALLGRNASISVCGHVPGITKETVESKEYSEYYKIIPFKIVDGINDKGICVNTNVVPIEDGSSERGKTVPEIEARHTLCSRMLPRFILDNFSNASEAVEYIQNYVAVFDDPSLTREHNYGLHVMIADRTRTYVLEFAKVDGVLRNVVRSDVSVMTNFQLFGVELNNDGSVYTPKDHFVNPSHDPITTNNVTPHGAGLERYNIANSRIDGIETLAQMRQLLNDLKYTNTYKDRAGQSVWYSEFVGYSEEYEVDLRLDSNQGIFNTAYEIGKNTYENTTREKGDTWQTVHSGVYNMDDGSLSIIFQEGAEGFETEHKFVVGEIWTEGTGNNSINSKGNFLSGGTANGNYSTAEGCNNVANGDFSHVEGRGSTTTGVYSHAEGNSSKASATASHAEGIGTTTARDNYDIDAAGSHAEGIGTITNNESEHAEGKYNVSNRNSNVYGNYGNTQHSIGIGSGEYDRKNAVEVMQNGDVYIIGIGDYDGTNPESSTTLQDSISSTIELEWGNITGTLSSQTDLQSELDSKQETLISGENIKTLNGESIVGEGNIEIKTFTPFPNGDLDGTLEEVVNEILSFPNTSAGFAYLGGISGESTPFGYGNVECKVEFMGDGIALLTVSSSDIIPYSWQYNTFSGDYIWKKYSDVIPNPDVETDTALSKISIDGQVFKIEGVSVYDELSNKPKIEGITLEGSLTAQDLGLATKNYVDATLENKVDKVGGKGLSTNDYTTTEKNKLAGIAAGAEVNVQSDWNATSGDSFIKNKPNIPTKTSDLTNDNNYITQSSITSHNNDSSSHNDIRASVSNINNKIPSEASTTNQLADKDFVNSTIQNVAAFYITKNAVGDPFSTESEMRTATPVYSGGQVRVPTRNDYCIVLKDETKTITETGEQPTTRYIYNPVEGMTEYNPSYWRYQYIVNNSGLTASQLQAVNSGITSTLVGQINTNKTDIETLQQSKISKPQTQGTEGQFLSLDSSLNPIWRSSSASVAWGNITGTMTSQTDLMDALNEKQDTISDLEEIRSGAAAGATALQEVPSTYRTASEQDSIDVGKVDKVTGKGLSTNDYTTTEKNKLAGIAEGAEVNVQANWAQTNTGADDYIKNKPTIPSKVSDLTNDSGFQTATQVQTTVNSYHDSTKQDVISDLNTIRSGAELGATALQEVPSTYRAASEQDVIDAGKVDKVTGKGLSTNDYTTTEKNKLDGIAAGAEVNVQSDWNQADTMADDYIKNKPTIPAAANNGVLTIQRNGTQLGTFSANQSTNQTINISVPTALSGLADDSTHRVVTDTEKSTWNGKSIVSGANDGTNWTSITIDGVTKNVPSGGGGGGLTNHNFTFTELTNNTVTYSFAADQRCYQRVTMTAGATINFQINNSSDNYVRFYNSSASDITLAIGSVTYNGSSVPTTIIPDDTVSVKAGKYVEIGVLANSIECDITISSGLKIK